MAADRLPDPGCTGGSHDCLATVHLHGCFSDAGNCDRPSEHLRAPVSAAVSPAGPSRRRITVTHTHSATFVQAEVDAVWNSGVLPIPNAEYVRADDPDARAIAVFEALDGSLLELFYGAADDDTGYEVEDYDPEA